MGAAGQQDTGQSVGDAPDEISHVPINVGNIVASRSAPIAAAVGCHVERIARIAIVRAIALCCSLFVRSFHRITISTNGISIKTAHSTAAMMPARRP